LSEESGGNEKGRIHAPASARAGGSNVIEVNRLETGRTFQA